MIQNRHFIFQFVGIIVLICGYCLSDQPDSWSLMHINPNPPCPSVFSKASGTGSDSFTLFAEISTQNAPLKKTETPKYISFEILLPDNGGYEYHPSLSINHSTAIPVQYNFLFFEEINPPPPKSC